MSKSDPSATVIAQVNAAVGPILSRDDLSQALSKGTAANASSDGVRALICSALEECSTSLLLRAAIQNGGNQLTLESLVQELDGGSGALTKRHGALNEY